MLKFDKEKRKNITYLRCCIPGYLGAQISWAKTPSDKGWYNIDGKKRFFWIGKVKKEKAFLLIIGRVCAGIVFRKKEAI